MIASPLNSLIRRIFVVTGPHELIDDAHWAQHRGKISRRRLSHHLLDVDAHARRRLVAASGARHGF